MRKENLDLILLDELNKKNLKPNSFISEFIREKIIWLEHDKCIALFCEKKLFSDVILLKGPIISGLIDRKYYKRRTDLDILSTIPRLKITIGILKDLGFTNLNKVMNFGEFTISNSQNIRIDFHYSLGGSSPFTSIYKLENDINRNVIKKDYNGLKLQTFSIEFTILYQIFHLAVNHNFTGFVLLFEISEIINQNTAKINTAKLLDLVKNHNMQIPFHLIMKTISRHSRSDFFKDPLIIETLINYSGSTKTHEDLIYNSFFDGDNNLNSKITKRILLDNTTRRLIYFGREIFLYFFKLTLPFRIYYLKLLLKS